MKDETHFFSFVTLIACIVLATVGYRYVQYVGVNNFTVHVFAPCDSHTERCFTSSCSPDDDPACPTGPYKKIDIKAADAPACLLEHTCTSFSCSPLSQCVATFCSDDTLEDGESCAPS